ncbi:O-antigen ligase family protein [Deinococcus sp. D7000]|nr:O-antigen ligase family protein [Deinococcus sp. D7000]
MSFDEVYLWPKIWWIYGVVLPSAIAVIWSRRYLLRAQKTPPLLFLLTTFLGWLTLSTVINGNRAMTWWGAADRADGLVMHLVYSVALLAGWMLTQERTAYQKSLNVLVIGGSLLAMWSLTQQLGLIGVIGEGAFQGVIATPAGGPLGQRGYMGGLLALLLPVAVMTAGRATRMGWWAFAGAALITWALAGAYTRGAWIAGIAGVGWLAVWGWRTFPKRVWLALPLGLCLFITTINTREPVREFNGSKGLLDGSQRTVLWNSALYGIAQRPVFGWGAPAVWRVINIRPVNEILLEQEAQGVVSAKRLSLAVNEMPSISVRLTDGSRHIVQTPVNKVHNEYLDYALTYGIPAALMFIVLLSWAIWSSRRAAFGLSAALVAYAVYLLTWPEIIRFAPIAWFMMGICLALGQQSSLLKSQKVRA